MSADRTDDFGARLRQARERKGITLRQIANRTKISVAVLEALERNDISRLPGGIFSRAFVRSYASEVGLDPEATIHEFMARFPHESVIAGHSTADRFEDPDALESDRRMARTVLWMLVISIPLAGAVLYFSMSSRGRTAAIDEPSLAATRVAQAPAEPTPAVESREVARVIEPAAAPASTTGASVPAAAATSQPALDDHLTVALSARSPVWVQATVDGQKAIERLLQTGERRVVDVQREMVLTAGDAAAVVLTVNGAQARPLGKAGQVVRMHLTPANFRDYLQTR